MSCNLKNEICGWKCTGFKGGPTFKAIRKVIKKKVDCEHCEEEGQKFVNFWQDLNHGGLGMPIHDKKNFLEWADRIQCVANSVRGHELE